MARSRTEIEVKLALESTSQAVTLIERLGATPFRERELEDNVVYDSPSLTLRASRRLLRLRRAGGRATLTYKSPVPGRHRHKVRSELESSVERPAEIAGILEGLGFVPWYRYQKYRTVYLCDGVEISLDETPIGCYLELEGEPDAIDRVASRLGFTPDRYILSSYRQLHEIHSAAAGVPVGDLIFDDLASPERR